MKTVIEMAREAGWPDSLVAPVIMAKLAEFAELVRADERARMAEQPAQQEPVAYRVKWPAIGGGYKWLMVDKPLMEKDGFVNEALYTSQPAQRPWAGLTDEEVKECFESVPTQDCQNYEHWRSLCARNIEAKLKEKNT